MTFQITILGSGSASPTLHSFPSAQVVTLGNEYYLIDCGEGTQYRLMEQHIRPGRLKGIFISHLHGDHYFGLFGLLTSLSLGQRTDELLLFGPKGLNDILTEIFRHSDTRLSYLLTFHAIDAEKPSVIYENTLFTVQTLPLLHRVPCTGFLFREKTGNRKLRKEKILPAMNHEHLRLLKEGQDIYKADGTLLYAVEDFTNPPSPPRSYAYCSDTIFQEALVPYIKEVDCLYHEATFREDQAARATKTYHSTARQAALIAKACGAGRLLIGHLSSRYSESGPSLDEARAVFPETHLASEGETFDLPSRPR
ncbi:ribonuclease Z [Arundinibacter roseus]|uniref:Ribonuclease Z n=1 Tax=Arundinibacter roseus TaxID=2070510 RepID=A0A4R4KFX9_9BACT|nr:ribonuclease Z [Arundinibacter roseus]TDB66920.1 ribonuclease Z [Arundinibacter roseus]